MKYKYLRWQNINCYNTMKIKYLFLTLTAVLLAGCSDELDRNGANYLEEGITATIPAYPFDGGTRVNIIKLVSRNGGGEAIFCISS